MLRVKFGKKNKKVITEGIKVVSDHIDQGDINKIKEIKKELLKEGVLRIQDYISNGNLKLIEDKFRNLLNTYLTSDKEEEVYDQAEGFKFKNVADAYLKVGEYFLASGWGDRARGILAIGARLKRESKKSKGKNVALALEKD